MEADTRRTEDSPTTAQRGLSPEPEQTDPTDELPPHPHYSLGSSQNRPIALGSFVDNSEDDYLPVCNIQSSFMGGSSDNH